MESKYIDYFGFKTKEFDTVDSTFFNEHEKYFKKFNIEITIIDKANNKEYLDSLVHFFNHFGYKTKISDKFGEYNVIIIPSQDKEYDIYHHYPNITKNCIICKNIPLTRKKSDYSTMRSIVDTIVNQLIIKKDLFNHRITLFNMNLINDLFSHLSVYEIIYDTKQKKYSFAKIKIDASGTILEMFPQKDLDIDDNIYDMCFSSFQNKSGRLLEIDNEFFVVEGDSLKTLPIIEEIYDVVYRQNVLIKRGKDIVRGMYNCYYESGYKVENSCFHYFSNALKPTVNVNRTVKNANIIRSIYPINDILLSKKHIEIFKNIIFTTFVRLNEYSVLPFLFKYISEVENINNEATVTSTIR